MEMIPRRGSFMPFECCARTAPLLNERAIRPFDPHALGSEHPAPVVSPNMLEYGTGLTSVDERSGPPVPGKSFELKQGSREIKGNLDGANGIPPCAFTTRSSSSDISNLSIFSCGIQRFRLRTDDARSNGSARFAPDSASD